MNMYPAFIWKHKSNKAKQIIFLTIPNAERWQYIAVNKLSALLKGIISKDDANLSCLNSLHWLRTKKNESHKKVRSLLCCNSYRDAKIFELNQYWISDKKPSFIYADLESLIKRIDGCKNNFEKSFTKKWLNIFHVGI